MIKLGFLIGLPQLRVPAAVEIRGDKRFTDDSLLSNVLHLSRGHVAELEAACAGMGFIDGLVGGGKARLDIPSTMTTSSAAGARLGALNQ